MRFAHDVWLWGVLAALLLAGVFVLQGVRLRRAKQAFGHEQQVNELLTARTGLRRAISAVMLCLAVAFAFVAAAGPQYGRGTRVLPATNLDVVLVLDFSKSMYARDVSPSRIARAKVEVARLVRELGGARFGAVAFAGESISFPLTSDGAAIAQFFKGLEPNDMPLGGTAIARALESGRQLLDRDPLSKNHEKVIILITDGEDLEGDPVELARSIRQSGTRVEVVQIGGRSPEPIPEIDENGESRGLRHDTQGKIMTTALSPAGEAQLASIAAEGGGEVVRAAAGQVGVDEMTKRLRRLMTEELSERVETVYADVFQYPLSVAICLLMLEVWIGTAKRRVVRPEPPLGSRRRRRRLKRLEQSAVLLALVGLGCDTDRVFERKSPVVEDAIAALQEGRPEQATELLVGYLETGKCEAGVIAAGERARKYSDAAYDLALSFSPTASARQQASAQKADPSSQIAKNDPADPAQAPIGSATAKDPGADPGVDDSGAIDCALRLLAAIGPDEKLPSALRARAYYLQGNLELNRGSFETAINYYDQGLYLAPGVKEGEGDKIGVDIAYNRALAQRLQKEKEEQEQQNSDQNQDQDQEQQSEQDQQQDKAQDDENEQSEDQKDQGDEDEDKQQDESEEQKPDDSEQQGDEPQDEQQDEGSEQDKQSDQQQEDQQSGQKPEQSGQEQPAEAQPDQASQAQNERMLDLLEQTPTLQQHDAEKRKAARVRARMTMEDK